MDITIHLIRHGEVYNPEKILYGRLPRFRLSATGILQARAAGLELSKTRLDALFSSPLLRARQTAREIQSCTSHKKIKISMLLNEVHTPFQGRPGAEIDARDGDVYTGAAACFEQPRDVVDRFRRFVRRMRQRHPRGQVAAVTHGDIITFMVLWSAGMALTAKNKTRLTDAGYPAGYPAHASITTLIYRTADADERPEIRYTGTKI